MAVIDSGCTSNVAWIHWVDTYLETLATEQRCCIEESQHTNVTFKFGKSLKCIKFPVRIGDKGFVIANDIPFLLSREATKRANIVINFKEDTISIDGSVDSYNNWTLLCSIEYISIRSKCTIE